MTVKRKLSVKESITMMVKQRAITTYEDVQYDEQVNFGRNAAGMYFRGEAFEQVPDLKEIARVYFENGMRIPYEFQEIRDIVQAIVA